MTNILITGGAGFIGSSLAEQLIKHENYHIVVVDNLSTGTLSSIPFHKRITWIKGNVNNESDIKAVMARHAFDYVFHYAAMVGVRRTLDNPIGVLDDINGIKNILTYSKNCRVKRVFFSSSSEVYGESVEFPQNEDTTPLNSRLPYAIVKNVGEAYLKSFQKAYGLDYTILRFFNTYGIKQSTDFVIPRFIHAALENKDIPIFGDGLQKRTFCYINDNVSFTIKALQEEQFINETVNVGSNTQISILELAQLIIALSGSTSEIIHLPSLKEGDMPARMPNNSRMLKVLNRELTPLPVGIREILRYKAEKASPEKIISKEMVLQPGRFLHSI